SSRSAGPDRPAAELTSILKLSRGSAMTLSNTLKAAVLVPLSLALLAGCGAAPKKDERPREEIVRERAQERWNLLVKKDFGGAYDYLSAGARALQDRQSYVSMMVPRPIQWTRADVKTVDC